MRFYTKPHKFSGGIDLHARTMYLGVLNQHGEGLLHRQMQAAPEPCLQAMAPSRADLVVCVEGLFTWDWLAELWAQEGVPFVLGHALDMKAIHGGKVKHDRIDAQKIAVLLRGGMVPPADVYPAAMRATRALLRRRRHLRRTRAERRAHIHHTNSPYTRAEIGKKLAYNANRAGVAERVPEPAVHKRLAVDLTLIGHYDRLLMALALELGQTAKAHDAQTFYRRHASPGVGTILALVRLYAIHAIHRFPRVQEFVSACRLVKCAKDSAGKRSGTSGKNIGNASLKWAFSEAAGLFRRNNPAGQQDLARLTKQHGKGKALTVFAHKLARAVYEMFKRDTACDLAKFLHA
jgi:transposase